jgi:hypothetical protein
MCAATTRQASPGASPRPRVAQASGRVVTGDLSTEGEYDEGDGRVAEYLHLHLLLLKLRDLEDARPVRFEICRLVDQLPVGTDGERLRMQQPVQLRDITGEHGGLQRPLLDEHALPLRLVAHWVDCIFCDRLGHHRSSFFSWRGGE